MIDFEKAELTLIKMLSKTKKVITTSPHVLCSVASYKLFYSTAWRVGHFHYYLCRQPKAAEWRLNKTAEFLGIKEKLQDIRQKVQKAITEVDKTIAKIDTFGTSMREAGRKIANAFRVLADKPEKEYGEKKFSKTEMMKKPFQAKRKLLSGVLKFVDAVIEKTEQLAADVKQYQADWEKGNSIEAGAALPIACVAESEQQYGAEVFEAYAKHSTAEKVSVPQMKVNKIAVSKRK